MSFKNDHFVLDKRFVMMFFVFDVPVRRVLLAWFASTRNRTAEAVRVASSVFCHLTDISGLGQRFELVWQSVAALA
jgi:hypothetical protein